MDVAVRTRELIRGVVDDAGLELVHVEYQDAGSTSILRIYIDKPGGVSIADCQRVSRQAGILLDVEDFISGHYTLEVSSPGLERPLFTDADYRHFRGKEVRIATTEKIENRKNFTGVLKDLSEGIIAIDCEGEIYHIPLELVRKAKLVYHFD